MIQITPQMRVLAAIEPADFRCGIDGLARLCKEVLKHDPFNGWVFVFRNRSAKALKILVYDGQGFWLCHKRLSSGKFGWWPHGAATAKTLAAPPVARAAFSGQPRSHAGGAGVAAGRAAGLMRFCWQGSIASNCSYLFLEPVLWFSPLRVGRPCPPFLVAGMMMSTQPTIIELDMSKLEDGAASRRGEAGRKGLRRC